ncbi:MAG: PIN domain-containing protein [Candidatus Diapherotrites archaeon]
MYIIDSNIFFEVLLKREHWSESKALLEKIYSKELKAAITSFSIHSIEIFMIYNKKFKEAIEFIKKLSLFELIVYNTSFEDEIEAIKLVEKGILDFDDALQYVTAKKLKTKAIVSYNKHFDSTDLKRITPKELI